MHPNGSQSSDEESMPALGTPTAKAWASHGAQDSSKDAKDVRRRLSLTAWWLQEIGAMAVSVASWTALVVILAKENGKPQEKWLNVISTNAIVSILATLGRSMMMIGVSSSIGQAKWLHFKSKRRSMYDMHNFDEASRGPNGSFLFLWNVRWQVATLGAVITILSVAVDAFAQQVVKTEARLVGQPLGTAQFSYAHNYSANASQNTMGEGLAAVDFLTVDKGMRGAILSAVYGLPITEPYSCPGSCSWEETYTSLGFRSSCQNVTLATISTQNCTFIKENGGHNCTMVTPGGLSLSTHIVPTDSWTQITTVAQGTISLLLDERVIEPITSYSPNDFIRIAVFRAPSSYLGGDTITGEETTECALSLTAYNYTNVRVNGTTISQDVIEVPLKQNGTTAGPYHPMAPLLFNEPGLPPLNISQLDLSAIGAFFEST